MFDFKKFLKEGGVEKYLLEAQFGNDIESRYNFIRPLMSRLNDSARTEMLIDGMEEARAEDDKQAFDFYFVEAMKELGLESELMEADSLVNPEAEEIDAEDLDAAADYFDSLAENDKILDEFLQMPAQEEEEEDEEVVEKEAEVTININLQEEVEGEVQSEAMSDQLKINKLLQAANTIEDSLNDVNLELTDDQIDKFTEMILDLRDKAKAKLK